MKRVIAVVVVLVLGCGYADSALAQQHGRTRTPVAGGIVTAPPGVPTGGDPNTLAFQGKCTEEFTGIYSGDHSHGTLTIAETFDGNLFTGSGLLRGDIVDSSGDATFRCSSGHLEMPFYWNAASGSGGYSGTWSHECS